MIKSFAEATAVTQLSPHTYSATFANDWCIGSVPHGGVVTACFIKVAELHFATTLSSQKQPHCIALHVDFLRRTQEGPALFSVSDTKTGRQASVIHISLSQESREEVRGYITHSNMDTEEGISFTTDYRLHPPPPPVDLTLLAQDRDPKWARQQTMPFANFRKATQKTEFHFPRHGQRTRGISEEWVRLSTGENWSAPSLGYICDMWPMPVEAFLNEQNPYDGDKGQEKPARFWYPTLLLNLSIRKPLPAEGLKWLYVRVTTKQVRNGRMDLDITMLDEKQELVAESNHVALALDRVLFRRHSEIDLAAMTYKNIANSDDGIQMYQETLLTARPLVQRYSE